MSRQHAPGWYRDPRDPGRLRRWNGRTWTRHTRPVPDWLRHVRAAPEPGAHGRSRARRFWTLSLMCLATAFVALALERNPTPDVESIADREFAREAERRCAAAAAEIRALPRSGDDANRIGTMIAEWELMLSDLRHLDVAPADRRAVESWFRAWREWLDSGADYTEALNESDREAANSISDQSAPAKQQIDRFALANGMPSCVI